MRNLVAILLMLVVAALSVAPLDAQARQYRLEGLEGGTLNPADLSRGVVIAIVFASWSPRGKDVVDQTNRIYDRWGGQARVIMVDFQEDRSDVETFLRGKNCKAAVYLDSDGSFSKRYSVTHLPGLLILKDGSAAFSGRLTRDSGAVIAQTLG